MVQQQYLVADWQLQTGQPAKLLLHVRAAATVGRCQQSKLSGHSGMYGSVGIGPGKASVNGHLSIPERLSNPTLLSLGVNILQGMF